LCFVFVCLLAAAHFAHSAPCYEVRYTFPSRLAFEQYNAGPALELKAAGIKKFEGKNLVYSRSVGEFQGFSPCSPFSQQ